MRKVSGEYTNSDYKVISFSFEVPSCWEELNPHQYASIVQLFTHKNADRYVMSVSLLALLAEKQWPVMSSLPDEHQYALIQLTNFVLETRPPAKNFFPTLKIQKEVYHAPAEDLSNIGFGEWCFAYQLYSLYHRFKDNRYLDQLIAVLYRPADPDQVPGTLSFKGDIRETFNENLIETRTKSVADVEERFKTAILAWFTAAVSRAMEFRPNVFPKTESGPDQEPEAVEQEDPRTWFTIFRELLGPKWGTTEQLKFTNAMFVLDGLEEQKIAYDEAVAAARS